MSITLYDITVPSYLQIIDSVLGIMQKAEAHWQAKGKGSSVDEINDLRVHEDMNPFSFQIRAVVHFSVHVLEGLHKGEFGPPKPAEFDFIGLRKLLSDAREELQATGAEDINAREGGKIVFKFGEMEIPFTNENFIHSFALPNFYFHATTAYDILRAAGVQLGKSDYLGQLRIGA